MELKLIVAGNGIEAGDAPSRIRVSPWGHVQTTQGDYILDDEAARLVIATVTEHAVFVPIDWEHQSLGGTHASPSGLAPAAGWIKSLHATPAAYAGDPRGGLWADVEWTTQARKLLMGKEYRYLSPVIVIRKEDRRAVGLHSVALTNKPATRAADPLVAKAGELATADTPAGQYPPVTRPTIIARASAEYDEGLVVLAKVTSRRAFVECALREAWLPPLSQAEKAALPVD